MAIATTMGVPVTCPNCKGARSFPWIAGHRMMCPLCLGDGVIMRAYLTVVRRVCLPAGDEPDGAAN